MALQSSLTETNIGIPLNDTYARITLMNGNKDRFIVQVSHYATADARNKNASPVYDRTFMIPFEELQSAADPLAMGYNWLKTQPEYSDAIDC